MPRTIALALAATLALCHAAGARPLLRRDEPARSLALSADADGDGFVTKAEIADAAARAVASAPAEFDADWKAKLRVYGLDPGAATIEASRAFDAANRILDAADADKDGSVTPAEMRAYAETFPVELRPDVVDVALALDRDADGTVSREERERARSAFAKEAARLAAMPAAERTALSTRGRGESLATWKSSTERVAHAAIAIWREAAVDGRASLGDIAAAEAPPAEPPPPSTAPVSAAR